MPEPSETVDSLFVRVGDEQAPIRLAAETARLITVDAGAQADDELGALFTLHHEVSLAQDFSFEQLLELRDRARLLYDLAQVLLECTHVPEDAEVGA